MEFCAWVVWVYLGSSPWLVWLIWSMEGGCRVSKGKIFRENGFFCRYLCGVEGEKYEMLWRSHFSFWSFDSKSEISYCFLGILHLSQKRKKNPMFAIWFTLQFVLSPWMICDSQISCKETCGVQPQDRSLRWRLSQQRSIEMGKPYTYLFSNMADNLLVF